MLPSRQRQQRRDQHSLEMSRYQTNLQRQQYQLASLVNQLQEVESKLEEIVAVRWHYSAEIEGSCNQVQPSPKNLTGQRFQPLMSEPF